jgi:hypothetical protein
MAVYDSEDRRLDLERAIKILEKLAGLDAKFDALIANFIKDQILTASEIKEILERLTLLEREGAVCTKEALLIQHEYVVKLDANIHTLEKTVSEMSENYRRLKWIIGSLSAIIIPALITGIFFALHALLGF